MKYYIAGKMRGLKYYGFPEFDKAKAMLEAEGHDVISPADIDRESGTDPMTFPKDYDWDSIPDGFDFKECRRRDIEAIESCDGIYLLKNWSHSKGARAEHAYADWAEKEIIFQ